jgi:hypothetical protein
MPERVRMDAVHAGSAVVDGRKQRLHVLGETERAPVDAEAHRDGQHEAWKAFVGMLMRATGGTANPKVVNELLRQKLN